MRSRIPYFFVLTLVFVQLRSTAQSIAIVKDQQNDWLLGKKNNPATLIENRETRMITIANGLISRSFYLGDNLACVEYRNLVSGEQMLRAVRAEARVTINGKEYNIGGLHGQKENAYFKMSWLKDLKAGNGDFVYQSHEWKPLGQPVQWKPVGWAGNRDMPSGKSLVFTYKSPHKELKDITIRVHYDLFDHIPAMCKSVSIDNNGPSPVKIDQVVNEMLATPEEESSVVADSGRMAKPHGIYVESNFAFNDAMRAHLSDYSTHWKYDSLYITQTNWRNQSPCLLEVYPNRGVGVTLKPGKKFNSIRTFELLLDGYDRERNGLARRKLYRTVAPWVTRNPIFMHLISSDTTHIKQTIDQCAETGYEAIILSFGSGLNMEDTTAANIRTYKSMADYAHSKKILLGGYSLFISRSISPEVDVIDPKTGKPGGWLFGGSSPCMASEWGLQYLEKIKYFFRETGFDLFENDGPYGGEVCASVTHIGHNGLEDSQWTQIELQKELYRYLNEQGVYINAPDWYFLDGSNKIGIGYREGNFSLPRERQVILNRQNAYDALWEETPSMVWGFVPLTDYGAGGAASTIEPLKDHLDTYEQLMMQYYGTGVQACYRGPRLYDTEETKKLVQSVIGWYKKYRNILNADIIHLRRPDGRDWDGIMHVHSGFPQKALAMLFNPLDTAVKRKIRLPLYYTGLGKTAKVRVKENSPKTYALNNASEVTVEVEIPAQGYTWLAVE